MALLGIHEVLWHDWVDWGDSCPRYCTLGAVAKENHADLPYVVANELISARVGMLLAAPVVPGICLRSGTEAAFMSLRFGPKGERPPAGTPEDLVSDDPSAAAAIVAFDCWLANPDRHDENFAFSSGTVPALAFDHDRALMGTVGTARLRKVIDEHCVSGCIAEALTQEALDSIRWWADLAKGISRAALQSVLKEALAHQLLSETEANAVLDFLCKRKDCLWQHIKTAQQEGLFPNARQRVL